MLKTCNKTESPPNPNKIAVTIILKEIFFNFIIEIILIPFVISNKPVKIDAIKLDGIPKKLKMGSNKMQTKFVIPLIFKIEITTENSTTNPPIIRIVEIAD